MSQHKKHHSMVLVSWIDSQATRGWQHFEKADQRPSRCESVGYLLSKTKESVVLAQSRTLDRDALPWGELLTIPRGAVRRIRRLERGKR